MDGLNFKATEKQMKTKEQQEIEAKVLQAAAARLNKAEFVQFLQVIVLIENVEYDHNAGIVRILAKLLGV